MSNENVNPLDQIMEGLKGLVAQATPEQDAAPKVELRYSTESVLLDATEEVLESTVRDLFLANADRLHLPANGDMSVRSGGEPVDPADIVGTPRTFVASVARETKGS